MRLIENVVLYFPYKSAGGVSELFLNFSELLVKRYNVFIIDFKDGYMSKNLKPNTNLITVEEINKIPKNKTIVIFQSIPFWNIIDFEYFDNNFKILFWNLHPNNFYPKLISNISKSKLKNCIGNSINWLSFLRRKKLAHTVNYLIENNSIYFMDGENVDRTYDYLKISNSKRPLLPVIIPARGKVSKKINNEKLIFAWVGRIADFKVHILNHLLERLNSFKFEKKIEFKIIGSGEELNYLKSFIVKYTNLTIVFLGECTKTEEDKYLQDVDILFAMGMSALEGAARSIPTFLLDYSFKPIHKKYKFIYTYENNEFNLGREINSNFYEDHCSFKTKIDYVLNNYSEVSQRNYEWWKLNYSNFLMNEKIKCDILENSKTTFGDIKKRKLNKVDFISFTIKKTISFFKKKTTNRIAYFHQY